MHARMDLHPRAVHEEGRQTASQALMEGSSSLALCVLGAWIPSHLSLRKALVSYVTAHADSVVQTRECAESIIQTFGAIRQVAAAIAGVGSDGLGPARICQSRPMGWRVGGPRLGRDEDGIPAGNRRGKRQWGGWRNCGCPVGIEHRVAPEAGAGTAQAGPRPMVQSAGRGEYSAGLAAEEMAGDVVVRHAKQALLRPSLRN